MILDYIVTHDDNREFALFVDTGWTEHVCVKTCNTVRSSYRVDFRLVGRVQSSE